MKIKGNCNCCFDVYFEGQAFWHAPGIFKYSEGKETLVNMFENDNSDKSLEMHLTDIEMGEDSSDESVMEQKKKLMASGLGTIRVSIRKLIGRGPKKNNRKDNYDNAPIRTRNNSQIMRKKKYMSSTSMTELGVYKTMNMGLTWEVSKAVGEDDANSYKNHRNEAGYICRRKL